MPLGPSLDGFREIWTADFEFLSPPGTRPSPICLVAQELRSNRIVRLWKDELAARVAGEPPYPLGPHSLFVSYYAAAELACHLALQWGLPARIIDLYAEHCNSINGLKPPVKRGLLSAMARHGLAGLDAGRKEAARELILTGGPWSSDEQTEI